MPQIEVSAYTIILIKQLQGFYRENEGVEVSDGEILQEAVNILKLFHLIRQNHVMGKVVEQAFADGLKQYAQGVVGDQS